MVNHKVATSSLYKVKVIAQGRGIRPFVVRPLGVGLALLIQDPTATYLSQKVSQRPTNQRGHGLSDERLLVQSIIVGSPSRNGSSSNSFSVTEKGTTGSNGVLGEFRLDETAGGPHLLGQ